MPPTPIDLAKDALQTGLRVLPFPCRTGLVRIGNPGRESPVFLTCNFDLTVRRVRRALRGLDCYLLVAQTRGINVWCAAGGGYMTANEVVSVIKTSGIADLVDHRRLVLPQLAATGVERREVEERTGWRVLFGPVQAEDIPAYLQNHYKKTAAMSEVRFNLRDRLEMAVMWAFPISVLASIPMLIWWRPLTLPLLAVIWGISAGTFAALPWLPSPLPKKEEASRRSAEPFRWVQKIPIFDPRLRPTLTVAAVFLAVLFAYVWLLGGREWSSLLGWGLAGLAVCLAIGVELLGSTPTDKSGLQEDRLLTVRLLEELCDGKAICQQVCPRGRLLVDAKQHKVRIVEGNSCVQCGACVVQCPEDALVFVYPDGRMIPPEQIRRYKLNMLGEREKAS